MKKSNAGQKKNKRNGDFKALKNGDEEKMFEEIRVICYDKENVKPLTSTIEFSVPFILSCEPDDKWKGQFNNKVMFEKPALKILDINAKYINGNCLVIAINNMSNVQQIAETLKRLVKEVNTAYKEIIELEREANKQRQKQKEESERNIQILKDKLDKIEF